MVLGLPGSSENQTLGAGDGDTAAPDAARG